MARDTSFFTEIKERVDLEDYLTKHLGVELVPDGPGRMAAVCPFHDEDTPSFKVMESGDGDWKRWWCFGACAEGGSVIDAAMKAEGFEIANDAAEFLNDTYSLGLEANSEAYRRFKKTVQETRADIERAKAEMDSGSKAAKIARTYLHNRGYSDETIEHFELAVDTSQAKAGRLSIPLIDKANHPVSVANRALFDSHPCRSCGQRVTAKEVKKRRFQWKKAEEKGEEPEFDWKACPHCGAADKDAGISFLIRQDPKYLFLREFDKANLLYHEHESRHILNKQPDIVGLFLVEGYADVWAAWQSGHKAICSYNGAVLSEWQANEAVELVTKADPKDRINEKPIVLVPDFDEAGDRNIDPNIRKLRSVRDDVEIQVVHGVDKYTYEEDGVTVHCKDLGELLQHHGPDAVARVLENNRWSASEWQIRQIVETKNSRTGEAFHSMERQMQLVAEVLANEKSKASLDHLVLYLTEVWEKKEEIIRDWFYSNLSHANVTSYQHLFKDIEQARIEAREFLQDDNVIPFGFEAIDKCLPGGGARPGQLFMALGKSGTGKAQSLDAKVLTPTGWKLMGEIEVGDEVVNPEGGSSSVVGVFPQGKRKIYRVSFSDGSSTECDIEHLWKVRDSNRKWQVKTLQEIEERINLQSSPHFIPVAMPIEYKVDPDLPVEPYLLGVLIGDACLANKNAILSTADQEIVELVAERLPRGVQPRKVRGNNVEWGLTRGRSHGTSGPNPLTAALRDLGLMMCRSESKFIPPQYQMASVTKRLELLRGLMDTDGSVARQSRSPGSVSLEYCTVSKQLADDVVDLVRSLGGIARKAVSASFYRDKKGNRVPGRTRYRVRISMSPEMNPFRLQRKAQRWSRCWMPNRRMVGFEYVGEKEAQCIALDSENQLYITDDFIVTHNTMLGSQMLANMADRGTRSIIFTLEQASKSLYPRLVCQALDLSPEEAEELIGREDEEAEAALEPVHELYKEMLIIDNVPEGGADVLTMTPSRIQAIVQEANMTHFKDNPAEVVIIDHLGILGVDEDAPADVKRSEQAAPGHIMERLFAVCKSTNVLMLVLQQLPKEIPAGEAFGYDAGRGGSKQTDYCDGIFMIWRPEQRVGMDETERLEVAGQYKLALGKNRFGPSTVAHLIFDTTSLRIMPAPQVIQPSGSHDQPIIELEDAPEGEPREGDAPEDPTSGDTPAPSPGSEAGANKESLEALEKETDHSPTDTQQLFDMIGAKPEDEGDPEQLGDPSLKDWFQS